MGPARAGEEHCRLCWVTTLLCPGSASSHRHHITSERGHVLIKLYLQNEAVGHGLLIPAMEAQVSEPGCLSSDPDSASHSWSLGMKLSPVPAGHLKGGASSLLPSSGAAPIPGPLLV